MTHFKKPSLYKDVPYTATNSSTMSNDEVKRWYVYSSEDGALYAVSKNQRGFVPDASTIEVMPVEDHERIVAEHVLAIKKTDERWRESTDQLLTEIAELRADMQDRERIVAELKEKLDVFKNREYGFENELELKQTIATQKRVIELLVEQRDECLQYVSFDKEAWDAELIAALEVEE